MPKPLSLKKVSSNQKPITQFFKNDGLIQSRKATKNQSSSNPSSTPGKRKVISPVNDEALEVLDEIDVKTPLEKQSKKRKTDQTNTLAIGENRCSKPKRELKKKGSNANLSPKKMDHSLNQKSCCTNSMTNDTEEVLFMKRSPLSPVKCGPSSVNCGTSKVIEADPKLEAKAENTKCFEKSCSSIILPHTPKKSFSATPEIRLTSPKIAKTPDKATLPLTKHKPSVKVTLDYDNNFDELFGDDWDAAELENNHAEDLLHKKTVKGPGVHKVKVREGSFSPKTRSKSKSCSPIKLLLTPKKKSPVKTELRRSPRIAKLNTPDKKSIKHSPKKAKLALDFDSNVEDMFGEEWDTELKEECKDDLDLSILQRCEVMSIEHSTNTSILTLKNSKNQGTICSIEGIWRDTPLSPGETISVTAARDASGRYVVTNSAGALVLRPDHLLSTTSVVAAVFCQRKALLQERFKGIDGGNHAMTIGILVHELVQIALLNRISEPARLRQETEKLIRQSTQMLYDSGLSVEETRASMEAYIEPLVDFMVTYASDKPPKLSGQKNKWHGHIDNILDIEENVCCPQLGLKGKIDATVQVTIHDRKERAIVPLELKTGRASGSAEHRGQIVLYNMMMGVHNDSRLATRQQSGLLLYLKEKADLREVTSGHPERRDLIMLRNQLVQYLADGPDSPDPEKLSDIEEASHLLRQRLPEPVNHETACTKCPYLTLCSLHLWHTEGPKVSPTHPLAKLREQALGHLSVEHITYLLRWSALLRAEERVQLATAPLRALWTESPEARSKRGICAANLTLKCVQPSSDRFLHIFQRQPVSREQADASDRKLEEIGPQEGEFSIVSLTSRPWIAAGVISVVKGCEIHITLERDLSRRLPKDTLFHIDQYQSYASTVQNLTNLGVLMEDGDSERLRKLIIDKQPPQFEAKLPREVGRLGAKMMKSLNIQQQRAVLKAVAAKDFSLLQGLPGTGKTQTISVMIEMLVALKQRVLVTAHTHSAVDNVLARVPAGVRVMRLGSQARVSAALRARTEPALTADCRTPQQLQDLYDSMEVVGVTCLGAAHAMLSRTVFDVCIVDEATQVLQCTVIRPLLSARRFVLAGDPDQLPPLVRSRAARRLGMEASLFHRLQVESATCALRMQYRMNQRLTIFANQVAYQGRLQCATDEVATARLNINLEKITKIHGSMSWLATACSPAMEHAALFIDVGVKTELEGVNIETVEVKSKAVKSKGKSCVNSDEACVILALIDALQTGGVASTCIAVIAPYREQVSLLRRVTPAEVSTVDQFQGRDQSVVLYCCTRSDEGLEAAKEGDILNDQRRMAVTVTRAKHKFIAIGHARAVDRYEPVRRMMDACTPLPLPDGELVAVLDKYGPCVR